jgi:hypothetical protein
MIARAQVQDDEVQEKGQYISDPSQRIFFAMLPHTVKDMLRDDGLSHGAFILYCYYKCICGEVQGTTCYQSITTIAEALTMKRDSIIKYRKELAKKKLIKVDRKIAKSGNDCLYIEIANVWQKNREKYVQPSTKSPKGDSVGESPYGDSGESPKGDSNKNPVKKNQNLDSLHESKGVSPKRERAHTESFSAESFEYSKYDRNAAKHLQRTLTVNKADLVFPQRKNNKTIRPVSLESLTEQITKLRVIKEIPEAQIDEYLEWFRDNYKDDCVLKLHHKDDLSNEWGRRWNGMLVWKRRLVEGNGHHKGNGKDDWNRIDYVDTEDDKVRKMIVRDFWEAYGDNNLNPSQKELDILLKKRGYEAGRVTVSVVHQRWNS